MFSTHIVNVKHNVDAITNKTIIVVEYNIIFKKLYVLSLLSFLNSAFVTPYINSLCSDKTIERVVTTKGNKIVIISGCLGLIIFIFSITKSKIIAAAIKTKNILSKKCFLKNNLILFTTPILTTVYSVLLL